MNQLVAFAAPSAHAFVAAADARAQTRFWEFFVSSIRNPHTRRAYSRAVGEFLAWCEQHGVGSIADVQPLHVGAYLELLTHRQSAPTAKQNLAAIRMCSIGSSPARSCRPIRRRACAAPSMW